MLLSICLNQKSDSSVLKKSMSEDDEWEKEEEVVLTSSTVREPAFTQRLIFCQDFGLGELAYADKRLDDEHIQEYNREVDKRAELQQTLENRLNRVEDASQW